MSHAKETILNALREILDPELNRDIVSLGMIQEIRTGGENVKIILNVPGSDKLRQYLTHEIQKKLSALGIHSSEIEFVKVQRSSGFSGKLPLPGIQHILAVASGKGGVGKTTVSVNLSMALSALGYQVGLMDGDIYGPNVPLMLGVSADTRPKVSEGGRILPIESQGIKMISMGVLVPADQPMVWRGPMLHGAVTQFLQKVDWGDLDFLIADLPPGTGDVQLSLVQTVPLTGAIMVTTPQEVSLMDVRKGIFMFQKTHVPILGILENMTGDIFGSGGGKKAADQFQVPLLGQIQLEVKIREGGDSGRPIVRAYPDHRISKSFLQIAESLVEILSPIKK